MRDHSVVEVSEELVLEVEVGGSRSCGGATRTRTPTGGIQATVSGRLWKDPDEEGGGGVGGARWEGRWWKRWAWRRQGVAVGGITLTVALVLALVRHETSHLALLTQMYSFAALSIVLDSLNHLLDVD